MNKQNLLKLARKLESKAAAEHFDMKAYFQAKAKKAIGVLNTKPLATAIKTCGTTACIAGWATVMARPDGLWDILDAFDEASTWLDLDYITARRLFLPHGHFLADGQAAWKVTPKQAAKVVRHLAETGEVDWSVA